MNFQFEAFGVSTAARARGRAAAIKVFEAAGLTPHEAAVDAEAAEPDAPRLNDSSAVNTWYEAENAARLACFGTNEVPGDIAYLVLESFEGESWMDRFASRCVDRSPVGIQVDYARARQAAHDMWAGHKDFSPSASADEFLRDIGRDPSKLALLVAPTPSAANAFVAISPMPSREEFLTFLSSAADVDLIDLDDDAKERLLSLARLVADYCADRVEMLAFERKNDSEAPGELRFSTDAGAMLRSLFT